MRDSTSLPQLVFLPSAAIAGSAAIFSPTMNATPLMLAIRGAGLYLCAELGGDVSLSRVAAGHWEHFSFEPVGV